MAKLYRKDFEALAEAIRQEAVLQITTDRQTAIRQVAENLAGVLAGTNPQFDRERFLQACGVDYVR